METSKTFLMETCKYCGVLKNMPCMSTRDMEDRKNQICYDALMRAGGGEYSVNRAEAARRSEEYAKWMERGNR